MFYLKQNLHVFENHKWIKVLRNKQFDIEYVVNKIKTNKINQHVYGYLDLP